jgi:hypothetical protein
MAEIVGVDHVSIGADQFDARGCIEDYTRWVHLVAAMLRGGFTPRRQANSSAVTTCASSALRSGEGLQLHRIRIPTTGSSVVQNQPCRRVNA